MWLVLAGIILCGLKIAGPTIVATWPWWLVTLPFWISIATVIVFALLGGGLLAALLGLASWLERK